MVGCGTLNCALRYSRCHARRRPRSSPMASCMASRALWPRLGSDEWPLRPRMSMRSIITPLCRRIGLSPVGSPITAARPSGRPASASARAPDMELSSSQVARINRGCLKGWSSSGNTASMIRAKKPFMSQLPSPTQRPSTSVSLSGSVFHSAASYGTVSLCPASTRPPGPLPKLANRLNLPG